MKKYILLIVLSLVFFECKKSYQTNLSSVEKDKLNVLLEKANDFSYSKKQRLDFTNQAFSVLKKRKDSASINYLFKIADRFYNVDENAKYLKVSKDILKISTEKRDSINIGKAFNYIGDYYYYSFKYDSAYYYYEKVRKIQAQLKQPFLDERITFNKASILLFEKNFSQAEVEFIKVLKKAKIHKNERMIYDCYLALGMALRGMNNNYAAIEYYNKAQKQTNKLKEDKQYKLLKAQPYNYIAIALQKEGKFSEALVNSKVALNIDRFKDYDPTFYCYLINTYSYSKFKLGNESCLKDFYETLKIGDSLGNIHIQLNSKLNLAEFHLKKNNHIKAKDYSIEVLGLAKKNKIVEDELKALELLAKIDPKNSPSYNQRYITLSDSLQSVERATRNKFARIEFETDEITNEKKVVEVENQRMAAQVLALLAFSFFVITALVLLYVVKAQRTKNQELQYKQQQQKANFEIYQLMLDHQQKIEEGKQIEKHRISRELHDGIMGRLAAIRLNLFVLKRKNDPETLARCFEHVNEIQNIEKEIRKIAHDLNHNVFADHSDFTLMVNNLVDNIKEHSFIRFEIVFDEQIDWNGMSSVVKMQVYRILQESLQNIEKYAQAKKVTIQMEKQDGNIEISVTDDGIGFNTAIKGGIGLKNIRERAAEIGATLKILSEKNEGTQIVLIIPT